MSIPDISNYGSPSAEFLAAESEWLKHALEGNRHYSEEFKARYTTPNASVISEAESSKHDNPILMGLS
jgi:hypothetical protein